jgi:AraC-like DNA-binding protein
LRRGADAYLSKPFDKEELLVRLEMLLERQQRMAAWFSRETSEAVPDGQLQEAIEVEDAFIQKVRGIIEVHYADENFALPALCEQLGMSRSQLFRKMKAVSDTSPSAFIRNYRLSQAKDLLKTTGLNVSEVAWQVGFKDPGHFSRAYQEMFGEPPSSTIK